MVGAVRRSGRVLYDPARHSALQQRVTVSFPISSGGRPDIAATERTVGAAFTRRATARAEGPALDRKTPTALPLSPHAA